ncbi:MAG TPA: response regulator transcription factor [Candidatus Paceibacterota bacterium]|nr:response regulator transcription factor [Candidatus Paceibacterota bacterium]
MTNSSLNILLVEDHHMVRQGVRRMIESESGMTIVGEASDGRTALRLASELKPDLVVMDVHLANENGIEFGRQIAANCPQTKIIALSSDVDPKTAVRALRAGFSGYVIKENEVEELISALRAVADGKFHLCPLISSDVTQCLLDSAEDDETIGQPELTERERSLLVMVAEGKRGKEIADILQVNPKSIETYRSRLMKKLNCASIADLTRYAIREGIVKP